MSAPIIRVDTLKIVRSLEKAGIPEKQAEAQTSMMIDVVNAIFQNDLATKEDLKDFKYELIETISALDTRITTLEIRMTTLETRMTALGTQLSGAINDIADLRERMGRMEVRMERIELKIDAMMSQLLIRLGGLMVSLIVIAGGVAKLFQLY